jgi:isochorismate synthase
MLGQLSLADLVAFLGDALERLRGLGRAAWITLPAPPHPRPEVIWELDPHEPASVWARADFVVAALGEMRLWQIQPSCADEPGSLSPLARLQPELDAALSSLMTIQFPGLPAVTPAVWGGMAFDLADRRVDPVWQQFGAGRFSLPRWTYRCDSQFASLTLAVESDRDFAQRGRWIEQFAVLYRLLSEGPSRRSTGSHGATPIGEPRTIEREHWRALVERVKLGIAAGRFDKVVLARQTELRFDHRIEPLTVLERLANHRSESPLVRFGWRREQSCFLGLTPEQLISKSGLELRSEALAGTVRSSRDPQERIERGEWLQASRKDRGEHRLVVDELRRRLRPLAADLDIPERPELRAMTDVLHLWTPIRATLDQPTGLLELVERLAPTPSVGGHPTGPALEFLVEHEPQPRGWYAGPIGWIDARGDGEFAVAIRSALIYEDTARVFAGAGIVRDSDPDVEWDETLAKELSLSRALGISP